MLRLDNIYKLASPEKRSFSGDANKMYCPFTGLIIFVVSSP